MPKKAVAIFFLAAFIGAAIFVYFTFPRTKDEIPKSNNQRPFPSAPGPNNIPPEPVPETVPHPNTPKAPPGPTLRVMAWATSAEAKTLEAEADAFQAATGRGASLTIDSDLATYRRDLQQALSSNSPPDLCLIDARDFSGTDPAWDLADAIPNPDTAPRSITAFTVTGKIKAIPDEFSVDVLFYNVDDFDQAAIGYPGSHWTWDMLEADSRALVSLKIKNDAGQPVYPLELPANFDFWNILCTQAGHPVLDLDSWHLADTDSKDSHLRALDFIHTFFQELSVTAPLPKGTDQPGQFFAQQRAAMLIGPSYLTATLPSFHYRFTVLPSDIARPASHASTGGQSRQNPHNRKQPAPSPRTSLTNLSMRDGVPFANRPTETPRKLFATKPWGNRCCRDWNPRPSSWPNIWTSRSIFWRVIPHSIPRHFTRRSKPNIRVRPPLPRSRAPCPTLLKPSPRFRCPPANCVDYRNSASAN